MMRCNMGRKTDLHINISKRKIKKVITLSGFDPSPLGDHPSARLNES